eukprot:s335_g5.t1
MVDFNLRRDRSKPVLANSNLKQSADEREPVLEGEASGEAVTFQLLPDVSNGNANGKVKEHFTPEPRV